MVAETVGEGFFASLLTVFRIETVQQTNSLRNCSGAVEDQLGVIFGRMMTRRGSLRGMVGSGPSHAAFAKWLAVGCAGETRRIIYASLQDWKFHAMVAHPGWHDVHGL